MVEENIHQLRMLLNISERQAREIVQRAISLATYKNEPIDSILQRLLDHAARYGHRVFKGGGRDGPDGAD